MENKTQELEESLDYLQNRVLSLLVEIENKNLVIHRLQKRLDANVQENEGGSTEANTKAE